MEIRLRFLALVLLTFASASGALARNDTGNEMLNACREVATSDPAKDDLFDDPLSVGRCVGMIEMLLYVGGQLPDNLKHCLPDKVSISQGAKVLVKFLDDHPQGLNLQATLLAVTAFRVAWPCQAK